MVMDAPKTDNHYRKKHRVGQLVVVRNLLVDNFTKPEKVFVWSDPAFKNPDTQRVGVLEPGCICLVLETCYYSYRILSISNVVGWVDWVDVCDVLDAHENDL